MNSISQEFAMSASAFMSEQLARDVLSLPMTPRMTNAAVSEVVAGVRDFVGQVPARAETVMAVDAG